MLRNGVTRYKKIEQLLGLLQWMAPILFPSQVMLRALTLLLKKKGTPAKTLIRLSPEAERQLRWWCQWAENINECPFNMVLGVFPATDLRIFTDAASWGIGAWMLPHRRAIQMGFHEMPP